VGVGDGLGAIVEARLAVEVWSARAVEESDPFPPAIARAITAPTDAATTNAMNMPRCRRDKRIVIARYAGEWRCRL
jgi:hypothetical protein